MDGIEKFNQFFSEIYSDRWPVLKKELEAKDPKLLRAVFTGENTINWEIFLKDAKYLSDDTRPLLEESKENKKIFYAMDPGSIYAASLVNPQDNDNVLDMCSAPGGKSLILLESLANGNLTVNEISQARRTKLKNVLREYAPDFFLKNITVKGLDGLQYGLKFPDTFDRILIDAPCSGEKHLIQTPKELKKWSPKRTKRLAGIQYGLLCSGLLALKSQGTLVYSTCSISPLENDKNIEKLLNKKGDQIVLDLPEEFPRFMERTEFGLIALPDNQKFGPLFVTRLKKL